MSIYYHILNYNYNIDIKIRVINYYNREIEIRYVHIICCIYLNKASIYQETVEIINVFYLINMVSY